MVVFKIDIQGGFAGPAESDPVISGHAHRPAFWVALQAVQTKASDVHVLGPSRYFQQLQDAYALPDMVGADPAGLSGEVNFFQPLVSEAADHTVKCKPFDLHGQLDGLLFRGSRLAWVESKPAPFRSERMRHPQNLRAR